MHLLYEMCEPSCEHCRGGGSEQVGEVGDGESADELQVHKVGRGRTVGSIGWKEVRGTTTTVSINPPCFASLLLLPAAVVEEH